MKLITIGDSITRGTYRDDNDAWAVAFPNYSERLQKLLGADELVCLGVNGVSMSSTSSVNSENALCRLCENAVSGDIIVVAGGTNDFGTSVEVGRSTDEGDISTCGALHILFTRLKKNNPNSKIYAVLPIPRRNENVKNEKGYVLDDYRAAIREAATAFGVAIIDGKKLAIDPENEADRKKYIRDGLHPNDAGHALYAQFLYQEILKSKGENIHIL
ncbi:MAG: SGNH/GDSL hydrolase family protein [Clostridia bacterium]|nr:SGNH/GDSL hydrolase family protein [Clostridia bacterium]